MQGDEFDDLLRQARHVGKILTAVYKEVTGEELDLEQAVRHYPLVALGLAAGAGALAGWWIGRGSAKQLPA